jgi:hypothetical protein
MVSFADGIDKLKEAIGPGHLIGGVEVDQIYAHWQHDHPEFYHPDDGKAFYLRDPLFSGVNGYMQKLADNVVHSDGTSTLNEAMAENMEDLSTHGVYIQAPLEFGDLKGSGHPTVTSDGETVYDRAPLVARLTEEEIKDKNKLSRLLDPHRYVR